MKLFKYIFIIDIIIILFTSYLTTKAVTISSLVVGIGYTSIIRLIFLIIIYRSYKKNKSTRFAFYFYSIFFIISLGISFLLFNWMNQSINIL
jgi:hypothetical protein